MNAVAGSTVMGAYEDCSSLADVCAKHDMWLHLDACWGGGAVVSKKYGHLVAGADRCDSIAWNLHKMLCAPLQCSAFITRHKGNKLLCFPNKFRVKRIKILKLIFALRSSARGEQRVRPLPLPAGQILRRLVRHRGQVNSVREKGRWVQGTTKLHRNPKKITITQFFFSSSGSC